MTSKPSVTLRYCCLADDTSRTTDLGMNKRPEAQFHIMERYQGAGRVPGVARANEKNGE